MRRNRRNTRQGRKPETRSTKPSDNNTGATNQVFTVGDSFVNYIRGYELSQRMKNCEVFVESFSGAQRRCMEDYIQTWNDVTTKQDPEQIAESIINLTVKTK